MNVHKDICIRFVAMKGGETRRFKAVGFLKEGESPVDGDEMLRRVPKAIGEEDSNFLVAPTIHAAFGVSSGTTSSGGSRFGASSTAYRNRRSVSWSASMTHRRHLEPGVSGFGLPSGRLDP